MKTFKKFDGTTILDVGAYVVNFLTENPGAKLTIGTDSKQRQRNTVYVSVICLQSATRGGVHIIYAKETVPRVNDLFSRLWKEVEFSKNLADDMAKYLLEMYCQKDFKLTIHLDLNPDAKHKSNPVYQAGMGYIVGSDYLVEAKPAGWAASYAADMLCAPTRRRSKNYRNKAA